MNPILRFFNVADTPPDCIPSPCSPAPSSLSSSIGDPGGDGLGEWTVEEEAAAAPVGYVEEEEEDNARLLTAAARAAMAKFAVYAGMDIYNFQLSPFYRLSIYIQPITCKNTAPSLVNATLSNHSALLISELIFSNFK